jgi:hypothetical protein
MRGDVAQEIRSLVVEWMRSYVAQPHPEIGRTGAVCPFVEPALRDDAVEIVIEPIGSEPTRETLAELLRRNARDFNAVAWRNSNPMLRSLAVVLPDLPGEHLGLLDEAHALVKPDVVRQGLMIGQFHPKCPEPAVRNTAFMVSRAPMPLVVIRNMALHDILFLHHRQDWFAEYAGRFGHRYRAGRGVDPTFARAFQRATETFGRQLARDPR